MEAGLDEDVRVVVLEHLAVLEVPVPPIIYVQAVGPVGLDGAVQEAWFSSLLHHAS